MAVSSSISTNDIGNLIDEFEGVAGNCINLLLEHEPSNTMSGMTTDRETIHNEVEQALTKFIDVARQVDNYFLQSHFFISVAKPEVTVHSEIREIREEIEQKDKLIQKYEEKLKIWKSVLSDTPPRQQPTPLAPVAPSAKMPPNDQSSVLRQQYLQCQPQQVPNVQSPILQLQQKFQGPPRFM